MENNDRKMNSNSSISSAPSFKSHTVVMPRAYSARSRKTLKNLRKKSFANSKTLKFRLPRNDSASIRKLVSKQQALEFLVKKYRNTSGEIADLYSYLFLSLGEAIEQDIKRYFWDTPRSNVSDEFKRIMRTKTKEFGLNELDIDDVEDYVLETAYFIDWLTSDFLKKHRDLKDDVETYAKHLSKLIGEVLSKSRREFLKKAPNVEPEETNDFKNLMSAFHKARI